MTGTSHKAIGVAVGAAFTIYGFQNGIPAATLAMVSAPIAAMLPDIDHDNSKMGRVRKTTANIAIVIAALAMVGAAIYYGWYNVNYSALITLGVGVALPMAIFAALSRNKHIKNIMGFATKHRGIMHKLLLPGCLFIATRYINISDIHFLMLIYGGIAGYVSHIFADCITKRGCPILFPLTRKNISLTNISTGSVWEKISVAILIIGIIAIPFLI